MRAGIALGVTTDPESSVNIHTQFNECSPREGRSILAANVGRVVLEATPSSSGTDPTRVRTQDEGPTPNISTSQASE